MDFERDDNMKKPSEDDIFQWSPEDDIQWTKEEAKSDTRFDFAAFLGPDSLEDQITDVLDGKDLLNPEAYGEFAPDYVPRRTVDGEHGRHEAPGQEELDLPEEEREEEQPPARPNMTYREEPPPRPKVVVAEPAPRVYVTPPEMEYRDDDEAPQGLRGWQKGLVAVAVIAAVLIVGLGILLAGSSDDDDSLDATPSPSPTGLLEGILHPDATQTPAPADTPAQSTVPPTTASYSITVTAGNGGSITPSGTITVDEGGNASFAITPNSGYVISQLLIDGTSVTVDSYYTFSDVRQDHTIYAVFQAAATPTPTQAPTPTPQEPTPTQSPASTPEPEVTEEPQQEDVPPMADDTAGDPEPVE